MAERKRADGEDARHTSSCKQAWKNAPEVNSVQRGRRRAKRGKDVPSAADALLSAGGVFYDFLASHNKVRQRVFAQWFLAIAPALFLSSDLSFSSDSLLQMCRHCLCASSNVRAPVNTIQPTPNPLCRLFSIKFPELFVKLF